jgi:hypothetical protein
MGTQGGHSARQGTFWMCGFSPLSVFVGRLWGVLEEEGVDGVTDKSSSSKDMKNPSSPWPILASTPMMSLCQPCSLGLQIKAVPPLVGSYFWIFANLLCYAACMIEIGGSQAVEIKYGWLPPYKRA